MQSLKASELMDDIPSVFRLPYIKLETDGHTSTLSYIFVHQRHMCVCSITVCVYGRALPEYGGFAIRHQAADFITICNAARFNSF